MNDSACSTPLCMPCAAPLLYHVDIFFSTMCNSQLREYALKCKKCFRLIPFADYEFHVEHAKIRFFFLQPPPLPLSFPFLPPACCTDTLPCNSVCNVRPSIELHRAHTASV